VGSRNRGRGVFSLGFGAQEELGKVRRMKRGKGGEFRGDEDS